MKRETKTPKQTEGATLITTDNILFMRKKPYAYQKTAFDFVCRLFGVTSDSKLSSGAALFLEMGLGKTYVSIAVMGYMFLLGLIKRVLIVAPLTVLPVWKEELEKFADFCYDAEVLSKKRTIRERQLQDFEDDVLQIRMTNYEYVFRIEDDLHDFDADLIIADEGHEIKTFSAKKSQTMHRLGDEARYKLLLTGTPITNHRYDIFSQYRFLNPEIFGLDYEEFCKKYFYRGGYGWHKRIFKDFLESEFCSKISSIAYLIPKKECLDLPRIEEKVIPIVLERSASAVYTNERRREYTSYVRLSQITGGYYHNEEVSRAKLRKLEEILDAEIVLGNQVIVITQFLAELDGIQALLHKKEISYALIFGGVEMKDREREMRRFQDPENETCKVLLAEIRTLSHGVNLTAANVMIFFSFGYSVQDFEQVKERIHRIGQTKVCKYYYLICNRTIDVIIFRVLKNKRDVVHEVKKYLQSEQEPFLEDESADDFNED